MLTQHEAVQTVNDRRLDTLLEAPLDWFGDGAYAAPQHRVCQHRRFGPRQVICREGDSATSVYAIRRGIAKLVRHLPNGRARIVRLQGPGSLLGLPANEGERFAYTAVAVDDMEVECLPTSYIRWLRSERPDQYLPLLENLHKQVRQADLWITEFSTGSIKSRVARLITFLSSIEEDVPRGEVELFTCQDMGEILGVTPESVSRTLAALKRSGVLHACEGMPADRYRCDLQALEAVARA
jgi:CRP-like cAMP-binding protein